MQRPILVELAPGKKNFVERLSPYTSLVISILAFALSIWSALETRRHDELSVKPEITFLLQGSALDSEAGIFLLNDGFGPARLSRLTIYLDGKKVDGWDAVSRSSANLFNKYAPAWWQPTPGHIVREGEKIGLYHIKPEYVSDWQGFAKLIRDRLIVDVRYCSFYDKCEKTCSAADDNSCPK